VKVVSLRVIDGNVLARFGLHSEDRVGGYVTLSPQERDEVFAIAMRARQRAFATDTNPEPDTGHRPAESGGVP
jgi:hypothetical protein